MILADARTEAVNLKNRPKSLAAGIPVINSPGILV